VLDVSPLSKATYGTFSQLPAAGPDTPNERQEMSARVGNVQVDLR